jgi:uncharacterized protein YjbI with pentapeptide repeats
MSDPAPPRLSLAEPLADPPHHDPDQTYAGVWVASHRFLGVELQRGEVVDLRLDDCDVSGLTAQDSVLRRAELHGTRLRGVVWSGGAIDDLVIDGGIAHDLSLRFTRLRHTVFRDCDLTGLDCRGTRFVDVVMDRCTLTRADFAEATVESLRLTGCTMAGVRGAGRLRGAEIDIDDLASLAPSLADELGIRVREASVEA